MTNDSFTQILKNKLDEMKDRSIDSYLSNDPEYQHAIKQQVLAEESYQQLNLTEEQKSTIDNLLHWIDTSNMEYSSLSYLAGLFDHQTIASPHPTVDNILIKKQVLTDFYNGDLIPAELPFESQSTTALWKELYQSEKAFSSDLAEQQNQTYQQLFQQRETGVARSVEDSFTLGFRMGAKFIMDIFY